MAVIKFGGLNPNRQIFQLYGISEYFSHDQGSLFTCIAADLHLTEPHSRAMLITQLWPGNGTTSGENTYTHHVQGELSRDKLLALAQQRYSSVQEHLRSRRTRLQEYGDYRFLKTWLLAVRGVQLKESLKLAVPPLVGDRTDY